MGKRRKTKKDIKWSDKDLMPEEDLEWLGYADEYETDNPTWLKSFRRYTQEQNRLYNEALREWRNNETTD